MGKEGERMASDVLKVRAVFDADTRRTHRFLIRSEDIQGAIYVQKSVAQVPRVIEVELIVEKEN